MPQHVLRLLRRHDEGAVPLAEGEGEVLEGAGEALVREVGLRIPTKLAVASD